MRLLQVLNWYKDERMCRYLNDHAELYMIEVRGAHGWQTIGDVALAPDVLPIVIGEAEWRSRGIG